MVYRYIIYLTVEYEMSVSQYAWIIKALSEASTKISTRLFEEPTLVSETMESPNFSNLPDAIKFWQVFIAIEHLINVFPLS